MSILQKQRLKDPRMGYAHDFVPIMANALATLGLKVTYVGALGYPNIHSVFNSFSERAAGLVANVKSTPLVPQSE